MDAGFFFKKFNYFRINVFSPVVNVKFVRMTGRILFISGKGNGSHNGKCGKYQTDLPDIIVSAPLFHGLLNFVSRNAGLVFRRKVGD